MEHTLEEMILLIFQHFSNRIKNNYVYITGITQSSDFPVTENHIKLSYRGLSSAFITKFDEKDGERGSIIFFIIMWEW